MQDIVRDNPRTIEMKGFVQEMVVADLRGDRGVVFIGMSKIRLAQGVLDDLPIESPQPPHGKILAADKRVAGGEECKRLELQLPPEFSDVAGV